jgi:hypothetical protein
VNASPLDDGRKTLSARRLERNRALEDERELRLVAVRNASEIFGSMPSSRAGWPRMRVDHPRDGPFVRHRTQSALPSRARRIDVKRQVRQDRRSDGSSAA